MPTCFITDWHSFDQNGYCACGMEGKPLTQSKEYRAGKESGR